MLPLVLTVALAAGSLAGATDSTELRGEALLSALRGGGYTVMLRHTRTDRTVNEGPGYARLRRAEQRNLNDDGVRDAKMIGAVMKRYGIPFGEILSSQMFRTRETAEYVAGEPTPHVELAEVPMSPAKRALVVARPGPGTNRLIVVHHFIIEQYAPGIRPGDIAEGEAAVVRAADDGTLTLVGRFTLADWKALSGQDGAAPAVATAAPARAHSATASGAPPVLPPTAPGKLAAGYLQAFNTGSDAAMRSFIQSSMAVDPDRTIEARIESYQRLFADLGPLAITAIESSAADAVTVAANSKRGVIRLTVKATADQPGRTAGVTFTMGNKGGH